MTMKKQINLLRGWPNPSLLPTVAIQTAAQAALSDPAISTPGLLYGPDPGYQPLRESISSWLSRFYGNPLQDGETAADRAERICITGGASQNLACALQVFTDPLYTRAWMVAPCYFLACRIFDDSGLKMTAVGEGEEGVDLKALEDGLQAYERDVEIAETLKRPKPWSKIYRHVIYLVPTFANPSGRTMSLTCRMSLVHLARKYDALIISDDVYDFLQWPTSSTSQPLTTAILPRLVDIDRTMEPVPGEDSYGNAMSNGSFSKISGPGVRTGWAEATPKLAYGLSQCGSSRSGGAPSQLTATIIDSLLRSGDLERHIVTELLPGYKRRYQLMLSAVKRHLVPLGVTVMEDKIDGKNVFGGYFLWLELPRLVDAEVVSIACQEREDLIVAFGKMFEVEGDESIKFSNSLRLCFAWVDEEDLEDGVQKLSRALRDVMDGKASIKTLKDDMGEFK
ncbi:hypothetical protein OIDMADRAFT_145668 [Oidiodendron maius Zn]|uniref:Aminotransferase class I/classII large domain-containing protein n=1 Tax=Oidiodendron maius (strain Zn) TaxID=913774 RepID=A0A0C3CMF9_OIDMZ|nr:hypothetical protein OIDMADRAFT_145668 [Oidiodendron maius Zn]